MIFRRLCFLLMLLFIIGLAVPSYSAIECTPANMPHDPDDTYCQSFNFRVDVILFPPSIVNIKCPGQGPCCEFQMEHYYGELGCCANDNCMNCLPYMDNLGRRDVYLWKVLTRDPSMWYCEGDAQEIIFSIDPYCINLQPSITGYPPSFCGNCDQGDQDKDVCVEFTALFNPILVPNLPLLTRLFWGTRCLPSGCWPICGSHMEVFIYCNDWKKCGDPDCVAL